MTSLSHFSEAQPIEIADIFRLYGDEYRSRSGMTKKQHEVMYAIAHCRTSSYGFHVDQCNECGHTESEFNSCRDRHCPKCQGIARKRWVESRVQHLLPVPYYHVVFTLPHLLHELILYNRKLIYDLLFSKAAETLSTFGKDPKWLGGEIGFFGVLHTWGQTLWQHPHVHFIVAGGALSNEGGWIKPKHGGKFLFPVRALSKVFRGKFIEGLKSAYHEHRLIIPKDQSSLQEASGFERWIDHLVARNWVVFCKSPFKKSERVVRYVGRYTHRVAISNHRLISLANGKVSYWFKDYKKRSVAWAKMSLDATEFIRRFLWHVLPPRFHKIRHFGFLANGRCKASVDQIRDLLTDSDAKPSLDPEKVQARICPACRKGILITRFIEDRLGRVAKWLSCSSGNEPLCATS